MITEFEYVDKKTLRTPYTQSMLPPAALSVTRIRTNENEVIMYDILSHHRDLQMAFATLPYTYFVL